MTEHTDAHQSGWALALAARRPRRRRRHPRPPDRRLRDRLPPRRALRRTASGSGAGRPLRQPHPHTTPSTTSPRPGPVTATPALVAAARRSTRATAAPAATHSPAPPESAPASRASPAARATLSTGADRHRRRRLPRALDRRPRRADRQGLPPGLMAPAIASFDLAAQARRHSRARRVHQVAEVAPPGCRSRGRWGREAIADPSANSESRSRKTARENEHERRAGQCRLRQGMQK